MALTTSTGAPFIKPNVAAGSFDQVFRRTDLINFLAENGRVVDAQGSSPFIWNIVEGANSTAAVFAEGDVVSTVGNQTYAQASLPAFYVRAIGGESGHMRQDRLKAGLYEDVRALEIEKATADLYKAFEDQLVGSTSNRGLASIIDSGDTYAGLAPGSHTAWASLETALGGALTVSALQDMYETLVTTPYGATPTHILAPQNQVTNYINIASPSAANSAYRIVPGAQGGAFDVGVVHPLITFNGLPVKAISGLATTELYMVDVSKMDLLIHRQPEVRELAKTNDDDNFMVSMAGALRIQRRRSFGKLTGVTA